MDNNFHKKFFFIAIGGIGMSGLAKYLLEMGCSVSGSDIKESKYTKKMEALGAKVYIGHDAKHIEPDMIVVASTAIKDDNPEKIRAKGTGLGGVLTPTGVGTIIEEDKQTMTIDGKKYIFEKPLGADFALIYGTKVDRYGNVSFEGTTRNHNTIMATAAETVIVQADELVDCLDPNEVVIPGLFIDYVVAGEEN